MRPKAFAQIVSEDENARLLLQREQRLDDCHVPLSVHRSFISRRHVNSAVTRLLWS